MEAWVKILFGLAFLMLSLGYLYRPAFILKFHEWGRSLFFNDFLVLHYRRRVGLLFFAGAVLFIYSGFVNMAYLPSRGGPSSYWALSDAHRSLRKHEYKGVVVRCQEILKREPDNIYAWVLLGSAWDALGRKDQARKAWDRVLAIDPEHPVREMLEKPSTPEKNDH